MRKLGIGIGVVVLVGVTFYARAGAAACPAADISDNGRRAILTVAEHQRLRAAYERERKATFDAVRKSSQTTESSDADVSTSAPSTLHVGASYVVSASAVDLCASRDLVTTGALLQGGLFAAETERWAASFLVGERSVFIQSPSLDGTRDNVRYRGLVLSGTARYAQIIEASAGLLMADRFESTPSTSSAPSAASAGTTLGATPGTTRAFVVTAVPGTHLSHGIVLSGGERPLATTYLAADDLRFWEPPIAVSGQVGYLDPTRQGFAATGVALTLPALRLGIDGSAETNEAHLRHVRASGVLGGTHVMSSGGAHVSFGIRAAASHYVGQSIESVSNGAGAPGFEIGLFAGLGFPWASMGFDARIGRNDPDKLAVLPASYGNGEGSIFAMVRITPYAGSLPSTFRGPFHNAFASR